MANLLSRLIGGGLSGLMPKVKPTKEMGTSGTAIFGGYVSRLEKSSKWAGMQRYVTATDIAVNTSIVAAGLHHFLNLIAHPEWSVVPVDEDDKKAVEMADFVEEVIDDVVTPWARIVRRAGMYRFHGFGVQEWTAVKREDGKIGFKDIEPRPQFTIEQWEIDDTGNIVGCYQRSPQTGQLLPLPRGKLVYLVDDTITDSPEGLGIFRHLAEPYERLKRYYELETRGYERDLRGTPIGRAPLSKFRQDLKEGKITEAEYRAMVAHMDDFVQTQVKGSQTGLVLDSQPYESPSSDGFKIAGLPQFNLELLQGGVTGLGELDQAINRIQREMARIIGVEHLMMGDQGGNRAMSEDKSRNLYLIANSVLMNIAEAFEADLLGPLWDLNGFDEDLKPKLQTEDVAFKDAMEVAQTLSQMASAGAPMAPDDEAINDVRDLLGINRAPEPSDEMLGAVYNPKEQEMDFQTQRIDQGLELSPEDQMKAKLQAQKKPPTKKRVLGKGFSKLRKAEKRYWKGWDESKHPRHPAGSSRGGEFARGDRVMYTGNFGMGAPKSGTIVGVDEKDGRQVYDVDLDPVPGDDEWDRSKWGYSDQFTRLRKAEWDESKHPRHPKGTEQGGEFAPGFAGASSSSDVEAVLAGRQPDERGWAFTFGNGIHDANRIRVQHGLSEITGLEPDYLGPARIAAYYGDPNDSKAPFATDMGDSLPVTDADTGEHVMTLGRYGIWAYDPARGKHQVIDSGNDLLAMRLKHRVHPQRVARVKGPLEKFDPNQPRSPKGSPLGGQWVDDPGSGENDYVRLPNGQRVRINTRRHREGLSLAQMAQGLNYELDHDEYPHDFDILTGRSASQPNWHLHLYGKAYSKYHPTQPHAPRGSSNGEIEDSWSRSDRLFGKYSPDQPRRPKGSPMGGQWTGLGDYLGQALANLGTTSRTVQDDKVDLSSSPGKADHLIRSEGVAEHATKNFVAALTMAFNARNELAGKDAQGVQDFISDLAATVNEGLLKPGSLMRGFATNFPQTAPADLPVALQQFAGEYLARLNHGDPIDTAAWVEWRANLSDHFWSDGVGKTSKILAAIPLMRAGLPLPQYRSNSEFYQYAPKGVGNAAVGGETYLGQEWQNFRDHYRSLMPPITKYSPDQARWPKGNPKGGKWRDDDSGLDPALDVTHGCGDATSLYNRTRERGITEAEFLKRQPPETLAAIQKAEEYIDKNKQTIDLYRMPDGTYTPERQELHKGIMEAIFTPSAVVAATPQKGSKPTFVLLGGRAASGKTTALRTFGFPFDQSKFLTVSADTIQENLPGYVPSASGLYNQEGQDIAEQVMRIAQAAGLNIIFDATLKSTMPAVKRVDDLLALGYDVEGYFVHAAPQVAAQRVLSRFLGGDRYLPVGVTLNSRTNEQTFDAIRNKLSKWALYDNNGNFDPKLVASGSYDDCVE